MKKQLALGIAGLTATVIGGFRTVRQLGNRGGAIDPVAEAPATPAGSSGAQAQTPSTPPSRSSSKAELYRIAQELGIDGRSKMTRDELLKAIEEAG